MHIYYDRVKIQESRVKHIQLLQLPALNFEHDGEEMKEKCKWDGEEIEERKS